MAAEGGTGSLSGVGCSALLGGRRDINLQLYVNLPESQPSTPQERHSRACSYAFSNSFLENTTNRGISELPALAEQRSGRFSRAPLTFLDAVQPDSRTL